MKRKLKFCLAMVLSFMLLLSMMGIVSAEAPEPPSNAQSTLLLAGQTNYVGDVLVWNDGENLYVLYKLSEDAVDDGWYIKETHLHVGTKLGDFPYAGRTLNPVPGNFNYSDPHGPVEEYLYTIPLWTWEAGKELIIAAHAVIQADVCTLLVEAPFGAMTVIEAEQGLLKDGTPVREGRSDPDAALTWDTNRVETDFYSLGLNGYIIVEFECCIPNGDGPDILIVEDTWGTYPLESANVFASKDGVNWVYLGEAVNSVRDATYDWQTVSYFDLGALECAKYVKVVDTTPAEPMPADGDGFDLNVIMALQDCYECTTYSDTAWAAGTRFNPKGNWATYFEYTVQALPCPTVDLIPAFEMFPGTVYDSTFTRGYDDASGKVKLCDSDIIITAEGLLPGSSYNVYIDTNGVTQGNVSTAGPWTQIGTFISDASGNGSFSHNLSLPPGPYVYSIFINDGLTMLISFNLEFVVD